MNTEEHKAKEMKLREHFILSTPVGRSVPSVDRQENAIVTDVLVGPILIDHL